MRPRSLAPMILVLVLGCRPSGDNEPPAADSSKPSASTGETEADDPRPPRPAGVIYRSELLRATQGGSPAYLLGQLGPEAYAPQGRFEGWVITRVWPADPELCADDCGLRVGDIILSVNGSRLETPEQLTNLLGELDLLGGLDVTGIRDGEFFERSYPILPDPTD